MDDRARELKQTYIEAEERQRDAYRRAVWMERHLYDAPTMETFEARLEELKRLERILQEAGVAAMKARADYVAASLLESARK